MKEPKHQSPYILKLIGDIMQKLQSCDLYSMTPVPLLDSLLSVAHCHLAGHLEKGNSKPSE